MDILQKCSDNYSPSRIRLTNDFLIPISCIHANSEQTGEPNTSWMALPKPELIKRLLLYDNSRKIYHQDMRGNYTMFYDGIVTLRNIPIALLCYKNLDNYSIPDIGALFQETAFLGDYNWFEWAFTDEFLKVLGSSLRRFIDAYIAHGITFQILKGDLSTIVSWGSEPVIQDEIWVNNILEEERPKEKIIYELEGEGVVIQE